MPIETPAAAEPIDVVMPAKVTLTATDAADIAKWATVKGDLRKVEDIAAEKVTFVTDAMRAEIAGHLQSMCDTVKLICDRGPNNYKAMAEAISTLAANPVEE